MYPYNHVYSASNFAALPPQMIPKSQKDKKWERDCMDALESVGRSQFRDNMRLIENYEMVKGKFIPGHYFDQEDSQDMITRLTQEFNMPSFLRHYDITSQVINTLSGEWQTRPDTFRVKGQGEHTDNEYLREQGRLLHEYVGSKISAEVSIRLLQQGIDENGAQTLPPDQAEKYQQMVEQARQALTPPQIQQYMKTDWMAAAEIWGQHQLELDQKRFRQKEKEKREFEDMLIADRCFRHFYLTADGYNQETWNPVNTFFHKSPDVDFVEDGDYVGRIFYLSVPAIIDRYGHLMTKTELESLQEETKKKDRRWNYATGTEYVFEDYLVPFKDYPAYDMIRNSWPFTRGNDNNIPYLDSSMLSSIYSGKFYGESKGYYLIVEGYWKSQKKIGKVNYIDPETGQQAKMLVDEDVIIPKEFKQLDSNFIGDTNEVNTVVWTYINEVYKGIKICTKNFNGIYDSIYLDIKPLEFQFKGDLNPYGAKLPVCGQVFSPRNSNSMSIVDLIKPFQIGFNVAINQAYQEMQKDAGKFLVMDVNMFADKKDWGGSQAYEKFMLIAKELGVTVVDTSPANTKGATGASGGHYPKEIDLDASARIISRLKIAEAFEAFALKQVGFNEYRLGQQASTSTLGGIQQGEARSFAQTESLFTNFSGYIQRCHKMNLDIAQYVQSQQKDVTVSYVKSDLSRAFIKLNGTELLLSDLHVYVWNSQEEIRQLESLKQLALSNNTMGASFKDLADVITSNSVAEIKLKLQGSQDRLIQMQERQMQTQELAMENEQALEKAKIEMEDRHYEEQWGPGGTRERIAYITTFNRQEDNLADTDSSGLPDVLEFEKLNQKATTEDNKVQLAREKLQADREKDAKANEIKLKSLDLQQKKINADLEIQKKELESVKILKGKDTKSKSSSKGK